MLCCLWGGQERIISVIHVPAKSSGCSLLPVLSSILVAVLAATMAADLAGHDFYHIEGGMFASWTDLHVYVLDGFYSRVLFFLPFLTFSLSCL